jgi:hypothetical protein
VEIMQNYVIHHHRVFFNLLISPKRGMVVKTELRYDTRDPFLIALSFTFDGIDWTEWVFARDLFASGLRGPAGQGDIRLQPSPEAPELIVIELDTPFGHAKLLGHRRQLERFLACSCDVVPLGEEGRWLDIDGELARLLSNGP